MLGLHEISNGRREAWKRSKAYIAGVGQKMPFWLTLRLAFSSSAAFMMLQCGISAS